MLIRRTKIFGTIAAIFFASALIAFAGIVYLIASTEKDLFEKEVEIAKSYERERALSQLAKIVEETTEERSILDSYIVKADEVIDFLALIEALGREQGVELETRSLNVTSINDKFEDMTVSMSVTGSYNGLAHLLRLFETLPYQSYISNIIVTSGGQGVWTHVLDLHVTKYKEQ